MDIDVRAWNVDLLSLSGHKIYGPKGIGALYVRRGRPRIPIAPLFHGGGHERGLRSGTLPVPLIVGLGRAVELLGDPDERSRVQGLRDALWECVRQIEGTQLNGGWEHRAPNNLNVSFSGVEAEALLLALSGVAVSTGSACTSETLEPSHVLRALGLPAERAHGALRFGLGRFTTDADIADVAGRIVEKVDMLRALNADMESW
jgi:cysteine desulfurase